jgi:hypothetical protein
MKALFIGFLATLINAAVAGLLMEEQGYLLGSSPPLLRA